MKWAEKQAARPIQEIEIMPIVRHWLVRRRFEKKYIPEPNSGCWLWTAACGISGHGQFFVRKSTKRKGLIGAHRVSWMIYRGDLHPNELVCHKCDTPACVNPDHLFVGTQLDNIRDAKSKGRLVFPDTVGEANSAAILQESDVFVIRNSQLSNADLAKQYGVSSTTIWETRTGASWVHLPGAIPGKKRAPSFTQAEISLILSWNGPDIDLARQLGRTVVAIQCQRSKRKKRQLDVVL